MAAAAAPKPRSIAPLMLDTATSLRRIHRLGRMEPPQRHTAIGAADALGRYQCLTPDPQIEDPPAEHPPPLAFRPQSDHTTEHYEQRLLHK